MRIQKYLITGCLFSILAVSVNAQTGTATHRVTLGLTSASAAPYCIPWVDSGAKAGVPWDASTTNYFTIYPDSQYQTIQGWGGAMQEKFWVAMQVLSAAGKDSLMRAVFDTSGCNFNFCRVPIGCCDFDINENPISCNDSAGDTLMRYFSLHRDSLRRIPLIKMAQAINPNLKFWGCPWSPPRWMHDNGQYSSGNMKSDAATQRAYALYLSKWVRGMRASGIDMEAICCQNEPTITSGGYPKCGWSNSLELSFYKNYLIPQMLQDSIYPRTKILLGVNCCGTFADWGTYFMNDTTMRKYAIATSHSYQAPDWGLTTWNNYNHFPFWETESAFGTNPPGDGVKQNWSAGTTHWQDLSKFMNNRTTVYTQWNIVNDSASRSGWGWGQWVMIMVDQGTNKVIYSPQYYAQKHFSYFVKVGAKAVKLGYTGSVPTPANASAFLNPNGDLILVSGNLSSTAYSVTVKVGDQMYKANFPANSFNTLKIANATAVKHLQLTDAAAAPAQNKSWICNSQLYFSASALGNAQEMHISLTDLSGRVVWTGHRSGILSGQQVFSVRPAQSVLHAGTYLLTARIKSKTGAISTVEDKVMAVN